MAFQYVHIYEDNRICYAVYGLIGKEYRYTYGDEEGKQRAIRKANAQGPNIERFLRNYYAAKNY